MTDATRERRARAALLYAEIGDGMRTIEVALTRAARLVDDSRHADLALATARTARALREQCLVVESYVGGAA